MLYAWMLSLFGGEGVFNLLRYITFRTGGALLTALICSFYVGPHVIAWLKSKQKEGQPIRAEGPESHLRTKKGTPTMGGLLILLTWLFSVLIWADGTNPYVWIMVFLTLGFGALGCHDDYLKLTKRNTKGVSARGKLFVQILLSILAFGLIRVYLPAELQDATLIPYTKQWMLDLGVLAIPFAVVVIVGASNAVNLTDGLDGLASGTILIAGLSFGLIAYLVGHHLFAQYLHIPFVPGAGELSVLCGALVGSCLGFLWFNSPPAQVFMGDTGSLALGAFLGGVAVVTRHEFVLAIIGGLFVVEAISVILQVSYFKWTKGKRIFLMAPLHHHFEKKGWSEPTIVIRFWIIAVILALVGLASLKLR